MTSFHWQSYQLDRLTAFDITQTCELESEFSPLYIGRLYIALFQFCSQRVPPLLLIAWSAVVSAIVQSFWIPFICTGTWRNVHIMSRITFRNKYLSVHKVAQSKNMWITQFWWKCQPCYFKERSWDELRCWEWLANHVIVVVNNNVNSNLHFRESTTIFAVDKNISKCNSGKQKYLKYSFVCVL